MPYDSVTFSGSSGIDVKKLVAGLAAEEAKVNEGLKAMSENAENISIPQMFEMQLTMNKFAQVTEVSSSVGNASHQALMSPARAVK